MPEKMVQYSTTARPVAFVIHNYTKDEEWFINFVKFSINFAWWNCFL